MFRSTRKYFAITRRGDKDETEGYGRFAALFQGHVRARADPADCGDSDCDWEHLYQSEAA